MQSAYTVTDHALRRMRKRRISLRDALRALEHPPMIGNENFSEHYDPKSKVVVVVNPQLRTVVTMFRGGRY